MFSQGDPSRHPQATGAAMVHQWEPPSQPGAIDSAGELRGHAPSNRHSPSPHQEGSRPYPTQGAPSLITSPSAFRPASLCLIFLALCALPLASASEGDRSPHFYTCLHTCLQTGCTHAPPAPANCQTACPHINRLPVSWPLRVMRWSCADDCGYACMVQIERNREAAALSSSSSSSSQGQAGGGHRQQGQQQQQQQGEYRPIKYHGKWPFRRVLGMQELLSVILSLANLAVHVYCCRQLVIAWGGGWGQHGRAAAGAVAGLGRVQPVSAEGRLRSYPYLTLWVGYAAVHVNAWLWSAVFHCRDTRLTERLDYSSAATLVIVGAAVAFTRALGGSGLGKGPGARPGAAALPSGVGQAASPVWGLAGVWGGAALALTWHLRYMLWVKFDYGWNMEFCLSVGAISTAVWIVFVHTQRHPYRGTMYAFLLLAHIALLLEVLDFPPLWGLLDAHAAWHGATVPLVPLLYRFIHGDAEWMWALQQLRQGKVLQ